MTSPVCRPIRSGTLDAVDCAKAIQQDLNKAPKVPLRIGLHTGDVIFRDNDIYGDAINIASRIESMGIPGAILVSKKIRDAVKNQADLLLPSLGTFEFKNVEEPIEVFALANEGFAVPKKEEIHGKFKEKETTTSTPLLKYLMPLAAIIVIGLGVWMWGSGNEKSKSLDISETLEPTNSPLSKSERGKRIAVMVFENQTMTEDLDAFGKMVSDWVTQGLMETGQANVISAANIKSKIAAAGLGEEANPEFANSTGVDMMLQGRYYLQENELIIHSNIVNIRDGEVIHAIPVIKGDRDKLVNLLDQLTQEVLGYWAVKKSKRFLQNPPKYEAYQEWIKGNRKWYDDSQFSNSEKHLKKAYQLDPTFYAPLLKLIPLYRNLGNFDVVDSLVNYIVELDPKFTEWESLRFQYQKASIARQDLKAGELALARFQLDPSDITANHNAAMSFVFANHPQKALDALQAFDTRFRNMNAKRSSREMLLTMAFRSLGSYAEIKRIMENYAFPTIVSGVATNHVYALLQLNQVDQLIPTIEHYNEMGIYGEHDQILPNTFLYNLLCNDLKIAGNEEQLNRYAQKLIKLAAEDDTRTSHLLDMADAAMYLNNWQEALDLLLNYQSSENTSSDSYLLSKIGVVYANLGNSNKANQIINTLLENKDFNKGDALYSRARVLAALGKKEEATQSLIDAFNAGRTFTERVYQFDSLLKPLFDYPPFKEFVKPRG